MRSYGLAVCVCGKEFERYHQRHVRCTPKCKFDAQQAAKACPACGGPLPRDAKTWCSPTCWQAGRRASRRLVERPGRPCPGCGTEFVGRSDKRFCSKACKNRGWWAAHPDAAEAYVDPAVRRARGRAHYARTLDASRVKGREKVGRRKALKRSRRTYRVSARDLRRLAAGPCSYCGTAGVMHHDHVTPLVNEYSTHGAGNLAPACGTCNCSKSDRLLVVWRYRVPRGRKLAPLHGSGPVGPLP